MAKKPARKAKKKTTTAKKRKLTLKKKVQSDLSAGQKNTESVKAGYVFRDVYAAPPSAIANVNALRNFRSL